MSFLLGLLEGTAESADSNIKKFLESDNALRRALTEKRITRAEREEARHRKELKKYTQELKSLTNKLGGSTDSVQFILDKYGYDTGKKLIDDMYTKQRATGKKITDLFSLAERTGPSVTIDQLANFYTEPMAVGTGEAMKGVGGGFTKLFGGEDYIKNQVMQDTEAVVGKLTKSSLDNIPETLVAVDPLEEFEIGYSLNYRDEYQRLMGVAANFLEKGDINKAAQIKISAEANYQLMENQQKNEYSEAELNSFGKEMLKKFVVIQDISGSYDAYSNFKSVPSQISQYKHAEEKTADLLEFAQDARKQGVPSIQIRLALTNAITKNKVPVLEAPADAFGVPTIKYSDTPLYTASNIKNQSTSGSTSSTSSSSSSSPLPNFNVSQTVASIKQLSGSAQAQAIVNAQATAKMLGVQSIITDLDNALKAAGLI